MKVNAEVWSKITKGLFLIAIYAERNISKDAEGLLELVHSALKLEKSAISKVQKHIICIFKNGKKSIFAPEKIPKIAFLVVLNFFLEQKLIFCHF